MEKENKKSTIKCH